MPPAQLDDRAHRQLRGPVRAGPWSTRAALPAGWERLGWATLATALDVNLGQPDYSVDQTGWRPRTKPIRGPAKPVVLGVLQAEHNLLVRLKSFPNAMNLRLIVDSQRLLTSQLVPHAERVDPEMAEQWRTRTATYSRIQRELRDVAGSLGNGAGATAEAANALSRMKALLYATVIEPRMLGGFQTLFRRIDERITDVLEAGAERGAFVQRVTVPRLVSDDGNLVRPVRERCLVIFDEVWPEHLGSQVRSAGPVQHGRDRAPERVRSHAFDARFVQDRA